MADLFPALSEELNIVIGQCLAHQLFACAFGFGKWSLGFDESQYFTHPLSNNTVKYPTINTKKNHPVQVKSV